MVAKFLHIQHRLNPLHLYCRFVDRGLNRAFSVSVCRYYEFLVFVWLSWIIKAAIHCCLLVNRDLLIRDEIREV